MAKKTTLTTELKQEKRLSTILQRELGRVLRRSDERPARMPYSPARLFIPPLNYIPNRKQL